MGSTTSNVYFTLTQSEQEVAQATSTTIANSARTSPTDAEPKVTSEGPVPISAVAEPTSGVTTVTTVTKEVSNPILPVGPELAWGAGTFFLLWALMKFVLLKPVMKGMEDRQAKIRADIDAADSARVEADTAVVEYDSSLASARAEATRIIEDARGQGEAKRKELVGAAEAEVAALRATAAEEIAAAKASAMGRIRGDVATIAVGAAGAVVGKQLDVEAHRAAVDTYLSQN